MRIINLWRKSRFSESYANYDSKTSYAKLGRALSDQQFSFDTKHTKTGQLYLLAEVR